MNKLLLLLFGIIFIGLSSATLCYQESANVSTACGGLDTGNYSFSADWGTNSHPNTYDGNWSTYGEVNTTSRTAIEYIVNYSKPINVLNTSKFQTRVQNPQAIWNSNYSLCSSGCDTADCNCIPTSCWNYSAEISLRITGTLTKSSDPDAYPNNVFGGIVETYCWDGSWKRIHYVNAKNLNQNISRIYEEAMFWDLDLTGPQISLNYPTSLLDYGGLNQTLQLNITTADTNLDKVWYNYNGTNITLVGAISGIYNVSNITLSTKSNLTIYANDTAGNLNTTTFNWGYKIFENSKTYNPSTLQTSTELFLLQLTKNTLISSINATLNYNGTTYPSTVTMSGDNVNITNYVTIPSNLSGNAIFYWVITSFGTLGSTTQTLGNNTQSVTNFTIYSCTGTSPSGLTLNFTLYDESSKNKINGSFESTFNYFIIGSSGTITQSYNYQSINENKSNWMFCINSSGYNVSFSGTASYYADYYDRREYIFSNATVGNFTQNIPLYLSLIADTDVVTVTVQDQNYNPISGALVYIQEWNVGTNTYSTIGMFYTDSNGNGIINLELYNKWYRAVVSVDGEIVKTTDVQKLADTTWFINVELATANPYELFDSISHGLTFDNETNITTFVWTDGSGYIQSGCLYIYNNTNTGYSLIHSECVSSVAGIINYLLPGDGDYQLVGTVYLTPDYNVSKVTDVLFVQIGVPELTRIISPFGKILTFLFVGVATFLGVSVGSPIWGSMLLIGSLFLTFKLGWIKLSSAILWGLLSVVIVIIFRQKRRVG